MKQAKIISIIAVLGLTSVFVFQAMIGAVDNTSLENILEISQTPGQLAIIGIIPIAAYLLFTSILN